MTRKRSIELDCPKCAGKRSVTLYDSDGQAANCHINALVTQFRTDITLFVCLLNDLQTIIDAEAGLIGQYRPSWNIQGI